MICLDLSNIDNLLLGYIKYLNEYIDIDSIHIVHVVEDFNWDEELLDKFPDIDNKNDQDFKEVIKSELTEKTDNYLGDRNISLSINLLHGIPTQSILKEVDAVDPDLLVLGKKTQYRGQGILSRRIARFAHTPVLFVPETVTYSLSKILVPIKFSKPSAKAVSFASSFSTINDASVVIQHVYEYPTQYFPYMPGNEYTKKMEKYLHQKFDKFVKNHDLTEKECIFTPLKEGKAEDEIYNLSVQTQADLIISGARSKSNTAALLFEEQSEHMANYNFRVPLLIYKDKTENQGLLNMMLEELR